LNAQRQDEIQILKEESVVKDATENVGFESQKKYLADHKVTRKSLDASHSAVSSQTL